MSYYPIQLDIRGRNCLVVGGGGVGTRKVKSLLACGAQVTVVSPAVTDNLHCGARPDRATQRPPQVLLVPGHDDQGAHPGGCGVAGE
jgi:NAD(P)-dependent dehydrogenase (short-subunit alcohol dehydrogenase family)